MNSLNLSGDQFKELVDHVSSLAAGYLAELDSRPNIPQISGVQAEQIFKVELPEAGLGLAACDALGEVIRLSRVQNGRFFGYVLGSGEPVAAVADLLASVLNQNVTAWRSSPAAVSVEKTVVEWLATAVGCPGFRGSLTGGGSSANLMALAMARER